MSDPFLPADLLDFNMVVLSKGRQEARTTYATWKPAYLSEDLDDDQMKSFLEILGELKTDYTVLQLDVTTEGKTRASFLLSPKAVEAYNQANETLRKNAGISIN